MFSLQSRPEMCGVAQALMMIAFVLLVFLCVSIGANGAVVFYIVADSVRGIPNSIGIHTCCSKALLYMYVPPVARLYSVATCIPCLPLAYTKQFNRTRLVYPLFRVLVSFAYSHARVVLSMHRWPLKLSMGRFEQRKQQTRLWQHEICTQG